MILKLVREGLGRVIVFADFLTRPKPLKRSAASQESAEKEAAHLALYQFYACPFCIRTRRAIHRLNIPIDQRDAQKNQQHRADLLAGGGRIKVPCLRIDEGDESRWIYESEEIIAYLDNRFGRDGDETDRTARETA